ncbi:MAG TPA: cytochrome c [Desulfuromonadaceae bacterium]|nr:cytochrome c [Desulfuromonadaceae bacterium]
MKNKILLFSLSSTIFLLVAGCSSTGPVAKRQMNEPKEKVDARGIFAESCATCHGADGRAKTFHGRLVRAQNLSDSKWQQTTSDTEIVHAIKTGPGAMPAFENKLSQAEIEALVGYIRNFNSGS